MHHIFLLTFILSHAFTQAKYIQAGPELDLVLREFGDFDLEVLSVEDRGVEDVVYLHRRAPEGEGDSCKEDDCIKFRAWGLEEGDEQEFNDDEEPEPAERRNLHTLVKRGKGKPAKLCPDITIDGNTSPEAVIEFKSYPYPETESAVVKGYKKVFDFEDITQPNTIEWFNLKNIETKVSGRKYVTEHVLEWQMFLQFLRNKKGKTNAENENQGTKKESDDDDDDDAADDNELCETLHKYWKNAITFDVMQPTKGQGNTWDLNPTTATSLTETPLEYIGHQYPGGVTKSPYTDEFVVLEEAMNGRKEQLWAGNSLSPFLAVKSDGNPSDGDRENWKTMQFNLEHNRWWDDSESDKSKAPKDAVDQENQGRCRAIGKFRDILGVYKYHQDDDVKRIMKAQIERVGAAFKTMEEDILPKQTFKDAKGKDRPPYQSLGLSDKWISFMKDEYDARIKKIEEWMEKWAEKFKDLKDGNNDGVEGLGKMFQKRAPNWTNQCGIATDDEIIARVELLLDAYNNKGKMENPLD